MVAVVLLIVVMLVNHPFQTDFGADPRLHRAAALWASADTRT
jgi:hypothetical protein